VNVIYRSRDSSVGIATGDGQDGRSSVFTFMLVSSKLTTVVESQKGTEKEREIVEERKK
jgi:hypothetical protein